MFILPNCCYVMLDMPHEVIGSIKKDERRLMWKSDDTASSQTKKNQI